MDIINDRKKSSDEKENDNNGDFIPIEIFEAITDAKAKAKAFAKAMTKTNTMTMATKVPVRHKRKFIALSSSSEEQDKPDQNKQDKQDKQDEQDAQDKAEKSPLITRRPRRTSYARRRPRKSL
jgi:hypothetical protein